DRRDRSGQSRGRPRTGRPERTSRDLHARSSRTRGKEWPRFRGRRSPRTCKPVASRRYEYRQRSETHVDIVALDWIVLLKVPYGMFTPLTVPPARTLALISPPCPLIPPWIVRLERLRPTPRSAAVGALLPPCPWK